MLSKWASILSPFKLLGVENDPHRPIHFIPFIKKTLNLFKATPDPAVSSAPLELGRSPDSKVKRYSILSEAVALIGDGVLGDYTNLPCGWGYCITLHQNLLQQRALCESVTPDIDYYSNSMLLDDVGNCVPVTDETSNCSHFE
ncbi:hypothetical protein Salat_0309300 [Sesamum alatum]|uniref:Uncharacterized protein n=1 Tax=Sesamum alatum TaxID=300844 RepID=A0AAE2CZH2_9LAMI|nr:hypothetical protein Salat_0309300 [Sesamum alatum]